MSARNMAKRTAAGTLALAVCLGGGALALAGAAQADANFKFDTRIAGDDRYATAIAASKAAFPTDGKTDNVVLVNGFATVDGLTASYLAGVANAPILYVSDKGADDATKAEIKRLGAKNVWLVGGTTVIPTSVETAIKGDGYTVTRINGSDRYETAKLVAEAGAKLDGKQPAKVFVASGTSFADALAVSPVAFAKHYAIVLTEKDATSDYSKKALGQIGTDNKILVGGEAVVSKKVQGDLSISDAQRVAGADRAVTANLVSDWAKKSEGFNPANAALVGGTNGNGADSLVASALGAKSLTTLHFAGWSATETYLKDHAAELTGKGFVFGGKAAVSDDSVSKAQAAAQTAGASNQTIKVTPGDATALGFGKVRQFSATGLDKDKTYRVTLVQASNIKTVDGQVTFVQDGTTGLAAAGTVAARLTVVNGISVDPAQSVGAIKPTGDTVSFTVTADAAAVEGLVPVIYVDGGASTRLELNSKNTPSEAFGLAGAIQTVPAEADKGLVAADGVIALVNKSESYFSTNLKTYKFSDKDSFFIGTSSATQNRVSKADFLKALSKNDTLQGGVASDNGTSYNPDFGSTFVVENTSPTVPTTLAGSALGDTSAKITFGQPSSGKPDSYTVYRAPAAASAPTKLSDWTKVGSVAGDAAELSFTDKGLTAGTQYWYTVTANVDSDESVPVSPALSVTTLQAGATAALDATFAGVTTDATFQNEFSVNDVWRVTFNNPVDLVSTSQIRVKDAEGEVKTITLGTGNAVTQNLSPVTIGGTTYPAKTVLTITFSTSTASLFTADNTITGGDTKLQYPLTITNASSVTYTDPTSVVRSWNPATSTDSKVDLATSASAIVARPLTTAAGVASGATVTFTANQAVDAATVAAGDFAVGGTSAPTVSTVAVSSDGRTITVTLSAAGTRANNNTVTLTNTGIADLAGTAGTGTTVFTY